MKLPALPDVRIGVIGLGYVGLPLAVYLARHFPVIAFDIDRERVAELARGIDRTREVTEEEFAQAAQITYPPMSRACGLRTPTSSPFRRLSIRPSALT